MLVFYHKKDQHDANTHHTDLYVIYTVLPALAHTLLCLISPLDRTVELAKVVDVPILHMPKETVAEIKKRYPKAKKVGLVATQGTIIAFGRHRSHTTDNCKKVFHRILSFIFCKITGKILYIIVVHPLDQ